MLTVLHVITRFDWGGSSQNTLLTALGHNRAQFRPIVVAGDPGPSTAQGGAKATEENRLRLRAHGIPLEIVPALTREVNPLKDLQALWSLIRILRREQPTIVHTHTSKAGVLGRLAAWIARVPIVLHTPHGHVFFGHFGRFKSWLFCLIEYVLAWGTTRMIALTDAERDDHLERGVGRRKKFAVISSGIDLKRFQLASRSRRQHLSDFSCPPDAIVVGSVGWLTEVKGHQFLIEAIGKLKPRYAGLHCVIIGGGPLQGEYAQLAAHLGVTSSIQFFEKRDDIPACLAAMDIFVLPSLNEGMGRALVEAMASGLPVVATRVGGVPAIVRNNQTGLLIPPSDVNALSAALVRLLDDPSLAKELGEAAQDHINQRFDAACMVRKIESLYEEALNKIRTPIMKNEQAQTRC